MAVYAISDLHLALSIDKPMDVFGGRWTNYMEKLKTSWEQTVKGDDCVIIPGDISWATYLGQAVFDFQFIESLPGRKIISKGNHDYWWTTHSKLEKFLEENGFRTISFMHNNSFIFENVAVCGTRGWKCPGEEDFGAEDRKIFNREIIRLEMSLQSVGSSAERIVATLHYPPFNSKREPSEFVELMRKYNVWKCIYGHLHGESCKNAVTGDVLGIGFVLASADHLGFQPMGIYP